MTVFFGAAIVSFFLFLIGVPVFMLFVRLAGLYAIVEERTAQVYVLFGNVIGIIDEPGLHFLNGLITGQGTERAKWFFPVDQAPQLLAAKARKCVLDLNGAP